MINIVDFVMGFFSKITHTLIYNPKKFFIWLFCIFASLIVVFTAFYSYKSYKEKLLINDINTIQDFIRNKKAFDIDKLKELKIKNHNIIASLLTYNLNSKNDLVTLELIQKTEKEVANLKIEQITLLNLQYSIAISYLQVAKAAKIKNNIELIKQAFIGLDKTRNIIIKTKKPKTGEDGEFYYVLQKHLDINILSTLDTFDKQDSDKILEKIKTQSYFNEIFKDTKLQNYKDDLYSNEIFNSYK